MKHVVRNEHQLIVAGSRIESEDRLCRLLSSMGLVERTRGGDWDFSKAIAAGSILFALQPDEPPRAPAGVVVPFAAACARRR
jgi:hypothetical protein